MSDQTTPPLALAGQVRALAQAVYPEAPPVRPAPALTTVPCTFCGALIPAKGFGFLSGTKRLLWATCPGCDHRALVTASRWRRLGGRLDVVRTR